MANKRLFQSHRNVAPKTNTVNKAGGRAYTMDAEHALCQYAVTGTFGNTFYTSAKEQLSTVQSLADKCSSEVIAAAAVYGHKHGKMKDVPAYLLAVLAARGETNIVKTIFPHVCTNVKMLLNFVQIVRSGVTGRRSFGTAIKKLIQNWMNVRPEDAVFKASFGHQDPSLADVIKMVHPRPDTSTRAALYAYLIGREFDGRCLQGEARKFEWFKESNENEIPNLPFQALSNCELTESHWKEIANGMPWNTLRMNLNQLARHNVFSDKGLTALLGRKISNPELVRRFNAFPYQLLMTHKAISENTDIPMDIKLAIQDALEIATENTPSFGCNVAVCPDLSGSMGQPVTGSGGFHCPPTQVSCYDVVSLTSSCVLRNNPNAKVIAWASYVEEVNLNPRDSIATNAQTLAGYSRKLGGGTQTSLALQYLNQQNWKGDLVIYLSDNESWIGGRSIWGHNDSTATMQEWKKFKKRNPKAKMVCVDIRANTTTQAPDNGKDILNVGGFNDSFWLAAERFVKHGDTDFVKTVMSVEI